MPEQMDTEQEMRAGLSRTGIRLELPDQTVERLRCDLLDHIANTEMKTDIATSFAHLSDPNVEAMRSTVSAQIHGEQPVEQVNLQLQTAGSQLRTHAGLVRRIAVAALVAAFATLALIPLVRSNPAQAMLDLAVAVEALPAESFGSSYTTFEQTKTAVADGSVPSPDGNERNIPVRFELVQVRRYAPDGSYQIEDTFTEATPVGDASTAEEAFLAAIYPVGETETATLPPGSANLDRFDTSGTVDEVRNRIDEAISQSGDVKADHAAQVLDFVEALYASQLLEPSDRATLIEIIATTPGVRISEPGADLVTAATLYTAPEGFDAELRLTFVSTGWLRESTRSAVGTYQPWQLAPGDSFATVSYSVPTASR